MIKEEETAIQTVRDGKLDHEKKRGREGESATRSQARKRNGTGRLN